MSVSNRSTFTLTFAIEILGIEVWHDCEEGWLDLGPCLQAIKIQYQLYYGQTFDIDVLIWPHTAKIICGSEFCWVRTWLFLDRRWITFSISHAFPVRVMDLKDFEATVIPSPGSKAEKALEVYFPHLAFGERRQFAPVLETLEASMEQYIYDLIWKPLLGHIPTSLLDGPFDVPHNVTNVRHQDAILDHVQDIILNRQMPDEIDEIPLEIKIEDPRKDLRKISKINKDTKEKEKKPVEQVKIKLEIKLSGDKILAGAGRIVSFDTVGSPPPDMGEFITLISTNNLPANDDLPIFFVNIETLCDVPLEELKRLRISQVYTRWTMGTETHESEPQFVKVKHDHNLKINDHHAVILEPEIATRLTATEFLDSPYEIQLRGIRLPPTSQAKPTFFGYEKADHNFGLAYPPKFINEETDILIAVTHIDARSLAKCTNGLVRGDYPLYPPRVSIETIEREGMCTNDINAIRGKLRPRLYVPPDVVLNAQMNLEASIGLVGCKPKKLTQSFSRLYCLINDSKIIMAILKKVTAINDEIAIAGQLGGLLTGFAIDTGDVILYFIEGPRDGKILEIWEMTEDFYPELKPVFSSSLRYSSRIYPELLAAAAPFVILKMFVPLDIILACPSIYARPALPIPTRYAALKIGRLIASKLHKAPRRCEMPSAGELKSFRLELCSPPRPNLSQPPETLKEVSSTIDHKKQTATCGRINWDK